MSGTTILRPVIAIRGDPVEVVSNDSRNKSRDRSESCNQKTWPSHRCFDRFMFDSSSA